MVDEIGPTLRFATVAVTRTPGTSAVDDTD
jgi:hypothetical protein